jgi:hypothetical protein
MAMQNKLARDQALHTRRRAYITHLNRLSAQTKKDRQPRSKRVTRAALQNLRIAHLDADLGEFTVMIPTPDLKFSRNADCANATIWILNFD